MKINIHAGHNAPGKIACGAVGYLDESREARRVKERVKEKLRAVGHKVYDCTVNDGKSQGDVLRKIIQKCNAHKVNLDISIHFNALKMEKADEKTKGTEVLLYKRGSKATRYAEKIVKSISEKLGLTNRGVKYNPNLYFLRNANAPAMLIEICFCDDADDVKKYDADKAANAIAEAIISSIQ